MLDLFKGYASSPYSNITVGRDGKSKTEAEGRIMLAAKALIIISGCFIQTTAYAAKPQVRW